MKVVIILLMHLLACQVCAQNTRIHFRKENMKKICDNIAGTAKRYDEILNQIDFIQNRVYDDPDYHFDYGIDDIFQEEELKQRWKSFRVFNYYDVNNHSDSERVYSIAIDYSGKVYLLNGFPENDFKLLASNHIKHIGSSREAMDMAKFYIQTVKGPGGPVTIIDSSNIIKAREVFDNELELSSVEEKDKRYFVRLCAFYLSHFGFHPRRNLAWHSMEITDKGEILNYASESSEAKRKQTE